MQATAAVLADLPAQFTKFKQQLLTELESQLLGNWGEQLKAAAAQETAQQVDAGLKVCSMVAHRRLLCRGRHASCCHSLCLV